MRRAGVMIVAVALQVAAVAGPAAAVKPVRGCAPPFTLTSREDLRKALPDVPQDRFDATFDAFDKNNDERLCVKQQPRFVNVVDNTSNAP